MPAEGYTWATMAQLNERIFEHHRDERLEQVLGGLAGHVAAADRAGRLHLRGRPVHPGRYAWTGRGTLADFVYECGPNHYRWPAARSRRPEGHAIGAATCRRLPDPAARCGSPGQAAARARLSWAISAPPTIPALFRKVAMAIGVLTVRYGR